MVFYKSGLNKGRLTQTTSSLGLIRLLSRIAERTEEPSLPVALVRANILMLS
jgi:hypothetical protein